MSPVFSALILQHLGFQDTPERHFAPPALDPSLPDSDRNRKRLLIAWLELSAWLAIFRQSKC